MILSAVKADNADVIILDSELTVGKELEKVVQQIAEGVDSAKRPCKGITDSKCDYMGHCGMTCSKCGKIHDGRNTTSIKVDTNVNPVMHVPV